MSNLTVLEPAQNVARCATPPSPRPDLVILDDPQLPLNFRPSPEAIEAITDMVLAFEGTAICEA